MSKVINFFYQGTTKVPDLPCPLIIVGCGNRGQTYARYAKEYPNKCFVSYVCEPRDVIRRRMELEYKTIKKSFNTWQEMLLDNDVALFEKENSKRAVVIGLQDKFHKDCAVAFAARGYHILLEKPMAVTENDCVEIYNSVKNAGVLLCVGHVLRYTPITQKVKEIVSTGQIGKISHIQHLEPIGWFHHAHSYVRGAWSKEEISSFLLMTKSCHDIDWLTYIVGKKCEQLVSFGSLTYFNKNNKPEGASDRCITCPSNIEINCPYSAKKIYLNPLVEEGKTTWPVNVIVESGDIPDIENVTFALKNGPYGRCVFTHDNNVADTQQVQLQYEDGTFVSFSMTAFSWDVCTRKTRIFGTTGELEVFEDRIEYKNFLTKEHIIYKPEPISTSLSNHGFADFYLMQAFVDAVNENNPKLLHSNAEETLYTHKLVFAAEKSRKFNEIIKCDELNKLL